MDKQRSKLRILLLQIRERGRVRLEEHQSFARHSKLCPSQIEILNVFDTPDFPAARVEEYDALFVGGASEASVLEPHNYPFLQPAQEMLRYCLAHHIPTFASCFGFQLAVMALGGAIVRDEKDFEMGSVPIQLTEPAQTDLLFHDVPEGFLAISVHRERAIRLPSGCELLAFTPSCCHALRVRDRPFWAFQFHPEVDKPTLVERLTIYQEKYAESTSHLSAVLAGTAETPHSNRLLEKFIDLVLLGHNH